jgi:hypothetical protein
VEVDGYPNFTTPHWGLVRPLALTTDDARLRLDGTPRDNYDANNFDGLYTLLADRVVSSILIIVAKIDISIQVLRHCSARTVRQANGELLWRGESDVRWCDTRQHIVGIKTISRQC